MISAGASASSHRRPRSFFLQGNPGRIALPVPRDDVHAGGLNGSGRQQPGTPVYGTDLDMDAVDGNAVFLTDPVLQTKSGCVSWMCGNV
jgi:hypothetical protein